MSGIRLTASWSLVRKPNRFQVRLWKLCWWGTATGRNRKCYHGTPSTNPIDAEYNSNKTADESGWKLHSAQNSKTLNADHARPSTQNPFPDALTLLVAVMHEKAFSVNSRERWCGFCVVGMRFFIKCRNLLRALFINENLIIESHAAHPDPLSSRLLRARVCVCACGGVYVRH